MLGGREWRMPAALVYWRHDIDAKYYAVSVQPKPMRNKMKNGSVVSL